MPRGKSRYYTHSVMSTHGQPIFSPITIVQEGEKRLLPFELSRMTVEEAYKYWKQKGIALSVA